MPLSIVVVVYDIARELPRTLLSLSAAYQRDVRSEEYEVIVVDNGSPTPVDASVFEGLTGQFRLIHVEKPSGSPAPAVNAGLRAARGDTVGVLLDGARLASPGIVRFALAGTHLHARSAVVTLGWYLGYDYQREALDAGWTTDDEDQLLASIDWPTDGYRLFEISTLDDVSMLGGWWEATLEASLLFLPTPVWSELGGYDERFDSPGGGLCNLDTLQRAVELKGLGWVLLLGEATFHQLHGGIATNASRVDVDHAMEGWTQQYWDIRQRVLDAIRLPDPLFLGTLPAGARSRYAHALNTMLHDTGLLEVPVPPPVPLPDPTTEPNTVAAQWIERAVNAARLGYDTEAMTFARWARAEGSGRSVAGPLLSYVAKIDSTVDELPPARRAQFHLEAGRVHLCAGARDRAASHFREVLAAEPENVDADLGLQLAQMPGPLDREELARLHVKPTATTDGESPASRAELQLRLTQLHETQSALHAARSALSDANAELQSMQQSRLFRWSKTLRRGYAWLRARGRQV